MSKVVLITGVTGSINSATAQTVVDAGWHVIGVARHQVDTLPSVHHFTKADLSDNIAYKYNTTRLSTE